jgi:hypothetical protein
MWVMDLNIPIEWERNLNCEVLLWFWIRLVIR